MHIELDSIIAQAESFIRWGDKKVDGLSIPSDKRLRLAGACLNLAQEHQKAIILLVARKIPGPAFSLIRLMFEAYVLGEWLHLCATENALNKYMNDKFDNNISSMLAELERNEAFRDGVLSHLKSSHWRAMCSFTHTGIQQAMRYNKEATIEPDFDPEELVAAINIANFFGAMSLIGIALLASNDQLANDCLARALEMEH